MFGLPATLVDYRCTFEAVASERHIAHADRLRATRDLSGHTIVDLH